jgi:hypothetical protein
MTPSSAETVKGTEPTFDVRWARWQEHGAAQDRAWNRRAAVAAVLGFCALTAWLAVSVYSS